MTKTNFCGVSVTSTPDREREYLGDWVGQIEIDDNVFTVRPDGADGALLNASGCVQIDLYDDGTRSLTADAAGVVSGVAGRVGQIVDGVYVDHPEWTRADLGVAS